VYSSTALGSIPPFGDFKNYPNECFASDQLSGASSANSPKSFDELCALINDAQQTKTKICIVGAGKSQGGQTLSDNPQTCRISLKNLNKLIKLDVPAKEITIQAGMTWKELQMIIAPHKLAVKAMQSYNNFSIGGSLGVNVHGQDIYNNPLIQSVKRFTLLQPDGAFINICKATQPELFSLVIGGYGLFGIVVEVTLSLTDDVMLQEKKVVVDTADLADYFLNHIKSNQKTVFYSARLSLKSSTPLQKAIILTYEKCDDTIVDSVEEKSTERIVDPAEINLIKPLLNKAYDFIQQKLLYLTEKASLFKKLRFSIEASDLMGIKQISRNSFMGYSIDSLPQDSSRTVHILQEYFIPYAHLNDFTTYLAYLIECHNINMLNVSVRHVNQDTESFLPFSPQDSCALVLYIAIPKKDKSYANAITWTRDLIDKAIALQGTFYLPYHLMATKEQLESAYPMFEQFIALKKKYDPNELFVNKMYEYYAPHFA
jgi:FAD/FMN-containing dehydrogenase